MLENILLKFYIVASAAENPVGDINNATAKVAPTQASSNLFSFADGIAGAGTVSKIVVDIYNFAAKWVVIAAFIYLIYLVIALMFSGGGDENSARSNRNLQIVRIVTVVAGIAIIYFFPQIFAALTNSLVNIAATPIN